jgi:hypothetical protein
MTNLWVSTSDLGSYSDSEFSYDAAKVASQLLFQLSGRKYSGVTTVTERYVCATRGHNYGLARGTTTAALVNGDVQNIPLTAYDFYETASDGITTGSRLRLRGKPVTKVHAIRDHLGEIINPNYYYLSDHSVIQPVRGVPWRPCNVEVTYTYGVEAPAMGKMAARMLAIEFCKMWSGEDCELPQRVTSIARQGVSYTILDPQEFVAQGRTGIYFVDLFLKSVNPDGAKNRARVFSPDLARARRLTPKDDKLVKSIQDITITDGNYGSVAITYDYLNAWWLLDGTGWIPKITINDWSNTRSRDLGEGSVLLLEEENAVQINVQYEDALAIAGLVDPGTWDMYASRPSIEYEGQIETVYVASGNLRIRMSTPQLNPIVTIGD